MSDVYQRSQPSRRSQSCAQKPQPLSNQDASDLIAFINQNDPRYTARLVLTRHPDFPNRAECFRRDTGRSALMYYSLQAYNTDAGAQVDNAPFQVALKQWMDIRN
jgi:hypothetical protein